MSNIQAQRFDDYSKLTNYIFPDYDLSARYKKIKERLKENQGQKFVLATIPLNLIHRLEYLRGHIAAWVDPYEHPQELSRLLDIMADIAIKAGYPALGQDRRGWHNLL